MDVPKFPSEEKKSSNWKDRTKAGVFMASTFFLLIYLGPMYLVLTILAVQVLCYWELINIFNSAKTKFPLFRTLSWYFLITANYYLYGETFGYKFPNYLQNSLLFQIIPNYHRFISFCLYCCGHVLFVIGLVGKQHNARFSLLALIHILLMNVVVQSYMLIRCMFEGIIWFLLPTILVIINDIFAYLFGRFIGKTPLIQVSPNKTWEGFIGGGLATILTGFLISNIMCGFNYFICPVQYLETSNKIAVNSECIRDTLFIPVQYTILGIFSVNVYPFLVHSLSLSLFASVIAPFGGFFASGLKRALKLKNFSDTIPGHGGIVDRFDCHFIMAMFVNVYLFTFIKSSTIDKIYQKVMYLPQDGQVDFYHMLEESLQSRNLL